MSVVQHLLLPTLLVTTPKMSDNKQLLGYNLEVQQLSIAEIIFHFEM